MDSTQRPERNQRLLARLAPDDFAARDEHLDRLVRHAAGPGGGLVVLAQPQAGCSELLRQTYDRLFREKNSRVPFYFEVKRSDLNSVGVARRFFHEFLAQMTAFRRADAELVHSAISPDEAAELAAPGDGPWIDRSIENFRTLAAAGDGRALVAACVAAPLRAAKAGVQLAVFIDGMAVLDGFDDGEYLFSRTCETLASGSGVAYVLAGRRRAMYARTTLEELRIETLDFRAGGSLVEAVAKRENVTINDQTRDLMAVQLNGNIGRIDSLLRSNAGSHLDTFERVEAAYTELLLGGPVGRSLEAELDATIAEPSVRRHVLQLLNETLAAKGSRVPVDYWHRQLKLKSAEVAGLLGRLHSAEMINVTGGTVEMDPGDAVVRDFVRTTGRIELKDHPRGLVVGESMAEFLRSAPAMMARHYRRSATPDLVGVLKAFTGAEVPSVLLDYARFKEAYKGMDRADLVETLRGQTDRLKLPALQLVVSLESVYNPRSGDGFEPENCAYAPHVTERNERRLLLAAWVPSKLEVDRTTAGRWYGHLIEAARQLDYTEEQCRIWLVAPEGFDDEACAALSQRGVWHSNRTQLRSLAEIVQGVDPPDVDHDARYEMTLPMGEDTEIIAAHTLEEIARRHNVAPKTINQIKTALVEALINAAEHSLSPDRKIYQTIAVSPERIAITVTNRGVRLADRPAAPGSSDSRRGWGLNLMRKLMDEVNVEPTDDGTSITLIKRLSKETAEASGAEARA